MNVFDAISAKGSMRVMVTFMTRTIPNDSEFDKEKLMHTTLAPARVWRSSGSGANV